MEYIHGVVIDANNVLYMNMTVYTVMNDDEVITLLLYTKNAELIEVGTVGTFWVVKAGENYVIHFEED